MRVLSSPPLCFSSSQVFDRSTGAVEAVGAGAEVGAGEGLEVGAREGWRKGPRRI
jgi:hypothetical protein